MRIIVEGVDISINTKKNALPTGKPVAGRFKIAPDCETASFVEEDAVVIYGDPKSKRLMRSKGCSVWFNAEKNMYKICVQVNPNDSPARAEWDFEECLNFIKRRLCHE